ncbi:MAG: HAD-IC family P-type ATPase, partial [Alishewanella sp.]|nr:HAD-IC family P-type ATPase [Alishewanella sp.]
AALLDKHQISVSPFKQQATACRAAGKTVIYLAYNGQLFALLAIADQLRADSKDAVRQLQQAGLRVVMVSGDNQHTANAVAAELGITDVRAQVLPADKQAVVQALQREFGKVAFVGDGINDAPALAAADVGIAIGSGTDIAIDAADVVLQRSEVKAVYRALGLSRAVMRNIKQNLFWAFAYNIVLIPVAAGVLYPVAGILLAPGLAAAAMAMSSVFVLSNALRLRRFR